MKSHEDVVNKNIDDILRKDYIKNMRVPHLLDAQAEGPTNIQWQPQDAEQQ
jgi:hypothetical protein